MNTPIICFTETQTTNSSDISELEKLLPTHRVLRNDNEDKFKSLIILHMYCFKGNETDNYDGVTYVHFMSMVSLFNFRMLHVMLFGV